jgi:hypothetical protein
LSVAACVFVMTQVVPLSVPPEGQVQEDAAFWVWVSWHWLPS